MSILNIVDLIPTSIKQKAIDATVDFLANIGKGHVKDEITRKIKKLRSDGAFREAFEQGLQRAADRFIKDYAYEDEDLVEAIIENRTFFECEEIQNALLMVLQRPGAYLDDQHEIIVQSFNAVLPTRRNRQRVDRAVSFLLKCVAEEVWMLPELRPIYELQFQRTATEALLEQVAIQKAQLTTNVSVSTDIREALLQLTDAIIEQKALPSANATNVPDLPFHNLPQADYERFIGRDTEIQHLQKKLSSESRHFVITIDGIGGIGKSTLALEVADRYRRQFHNLPIEEQFKAIVWITAKETVLTSEGILKRPQSQRTLEDIYTTISVTLQREDISRARFDEQDDLICQALTQQRRLLIIDNLETVDDERVLTFIREVPDPTKAIVTTRHRLDIAYPIRLVAMPEVDALQLIKDTTKRKNVILTEHESKQLYKRTGGVPLAIVWSVAKMGFGYNIQFILDRLGEPTSDIARFCFEVVIESIKKKPAYKLMLVLSLFVSNASREALRKVTDLPILECDEGLVELEKLSIVNKSEDRFSFLPLTKSFALAELSKQADVEKELRHRLTEYFTSICDVPSEYFWRYRDYSYSKDLDTILDTIEWSYKNSTSQDVFILTLAAYDYLETVGRWNKVIEICDKALELALNTQNHIYAARFYIIQGGIFYHRGEYEKALTFYNNGLSLYKQVDASEGEAITLQHLSNVYRKKGEFADAQKFCNEAKEIAGELDDGDLKALITTAYGKLARDMGEWESAKEYFTQVKDWFEHRAEQTPRDEFLGTSIWGHLAIILHHLGQNEKAEEFCLKSLDFFENGGNRGYWATLKYRIALIKKASGEYENAIIHAKEASAWFKRLGMKPDFAKTQELLKQLQEELYLAEDF